MRHGPEKVPVEPGSEVNIGADGTFRAYGLDKAGTVVEILGPISKEERFVRALVSRHTHQVEVRCGKGVHWNFAETVRHAKDPSDPTPLEAAVPFDRPLSLHEEMKRFIRDEVSARMSDHGIETLEESDDFNIDDDEAEPFSPYQLSEMQEDAEFNPKTEDGPPAEKDDPPVKEEPAPVKDTPPEPDPGGEPPV